MNNSIKNRLSALERIINENERYLCEYEDGTQERLSAHELLLYPLLCRNDKYKEEVMSIAKIYCKSADDPFIQVPLCILRSTTDRPYPEVIVQEG